MPLEINKAYEKLLNKIKNGSITQINAAFRQMIFDLSLAISRNTIQDPRINKNLQRQVVLIKRAFVNHYNKILSSYEQSAIDLSVRKNLKEITAALTGLEIETGLKKFNLGRPNKANVKIVSGRVWNINKGFYQNLDNLLKSGLLEGLPAHEVKLQLTRLLNRPESLDLNELRRQGILRAGGEESYRKLEQEILSYKPGRGVYRSSKKNAFRLARTEINRSYRLQDTVIRQKLPFVVGIEVKLSGAHPRIDICFTSWMYKVQTSKGEKYIKDIKIGDLVLTHKGRYRKVTKLFKSTVYEVDKTELSYKIPYDNRSKTKKISATSNHPFLINNEWMPIRKAKKGDQLKMIAVRCKTCNKKIPYYREFCSKSCVSKETTKNQWASEEHRKNISEKRKDLIKENNGIIPYFKNWIESGQNVKNLLDPKTQKKRKENLKKRMNEMVKNGTHPFQDANVRRKGFQKLGNSNNKTFIEKKIEWLLKELNIEYKTGETIYRDVLNKFGKKRFYAPDFILPKYNVIIEADGDYWHSKRVEYDNYRQKELESKGYIVLRFKGSVIREDLKSVADEIQRVVYNHEGKYEFMEYPISEVRHYTQEQITPITKWNFEVEEDNSYIVNGVVVHNCDDMQGRYPKGYNFMGWHPACICYSIPILATKDQTAKLIADKPVKLNPVKSIPKRAENYIKKRKKNINNYKTTPFFIDENPKYFDKLLK